MDVPAPMAGEIVEVKVAVGGKVSAGDALLDAAADVAAPRSAARRRHACAPRRRGAAPRRPVAASRPSGARAAPSGRRALRRRRRASARRTRARRCASSRASSASISAACAARAQRPRHGRRRQGVRQRRMLQRRRCSGAALPAVPNVDFAKFGRDRDASRCRESRRSPARACTRAGSTFRTSRSTTRPTSPSSRSSASALKGQAEQRGIKLTPLAFIIRACALALAEMPQFKSSLARGRREPRA